MREQMVFPAGLRKRKILDRLIPELFIEEILVLSGARQVGKTYLLYLLIRHLQEAGVAPSQIFLFNLEDPRLLGWMDSTSAFDFVAELGRQGADTGKKVFVFIDEIQYLAHPSSFLKLLFDQYPQIKLVVSGSSSFEMKKKFTDRLTGRKRFIEVLPLSLAEMSQFQNTNIDSRLWEEYLLYGGYPRVALRSNVLEKKNTLLEIYNDYVRKDVRDLAKIPDVGSFNNLVGSMSAQTGNLVSESEISGKVGLARPTVKKYLHILESTFVLSLVRPYSRNIRSEFVRMPKVYFKDTGLRNAIAGGFDQSVHRPDLGALVENAVFSELVKNAPQFFEIHFWRTKQDAEVDFIVQSDSGAVLPVEVKYSRFTKPEIERSLVSFINRYQPKHGVVLTKDFSGKMRYKNTEVKFLPAMNTWEVFAFMKL